MTGPANNRIACGGGGVQRGAIGILSRGGRYLMIRRAEGVAKGGFWCFPGGHLEPGETSRRAIEREFAEELGIEVEAVERCGAIRLEDSSYILAVWRVRRLGGRLHPAEEEIAEVRWVEPAEISTISPGLPSNKSVLRMLE